MEGRKKKVGTENIGTTGIPAQEEQSGGQQSQDKHGLLCWSTDLSQNLGGKC